MLPALGTSGTGRAARPEKSGKSGNETAGRKLPDEVARGEGMNTPLASADASGVSAWREFENRSAARGSINAALDGSFAQRSRLCRLRRHCDISQAVRRRFADR